jgi:hypothetical protein
MRAHSVFDVAMHLKGGDFDAAKIRIMELIGRDDLIIDPNEAPAGLALQEYADAKRLPVERLKRLGVKQTSYGQVKAAVRTPYFRLNGESSIRFRVNLNGDKKKRHYWRDGDKACLYGEWYLGSPEFRATGYIIIVEGESDCQTCWFNGSFPALGLPGAGQWNEGRDVPLVADTPTIFAVIEHNDKGEPDSGGKVLLKCIARSSIAPRVRLVRLPPETKDPSALYLANPEGFVAAFQAALDAAEPFPLDQIRQQETEADADRYANSLSKLIADFNNQYAVVSEAGKAVVYEPITDPILQRKVLVRITFAAPSFPSIQLNLFEKHAGPAEPTAALAKILGKDDRQIPLGRALNEPHAVRVRLLCFLKKVAYEPCVAKRCPA